MISDTGDRTEFELFSKELRTISRFLPAGFDPEDGHPSGWLTGPQVTGASWEIFLTSRPLCYQPPTPEFLIPDSSLESATINGAGHE